VRQKIDANTAVMAADMHNKAANGQATAFNDGAATRKP